MTTILPSDRSSLDLISRQVGESLGQTLPSAIQRYQGMQAINQLQNELQQAGGDISKILPAIARAYSLNPNLERSGLAQSFLSTAAAKNVYGGGGQGQPQSTSVPPQPPGVTPQGQGQPPITQEAPTQPSLVAPNVARNAGYAGRKTPDQQMAEAANAHQVSGGQIPYETRLKQLQAEDSIKQNLENELIGYAKASGITDEEVPDFMEIGEQFDTGNRQQWFKNTREAYKPIKSAFDSLEKTFIPGVGSGLLGRDRDKALKKITPDVQRLIALGRENQVREYLANQYLSPTEIAEQIHPLTPEKSKAIDQVPRSFFPLNKGQVEEGKPVKSPFVNYETALEKAPQQMQKMQDKLSVFFSKKC